MKHIINLLIIVLLINSRYSQNIIVKDLNAMKSKFESSDNDSILISKYSISPYKINNFDKSNPKDSIKIGFIEVINSDINQVLGPFYTNSSVLFIKTISIDSAYFLKVGNIWLDIYRGYDNAKKLAYEILDKVNGGKDFNIYCVLYSDDR
ncbi:MAG: hypothetical protein ABIJ97_02505, partial [Bacteroidota bacterium]